MPSHKIQLIQCLNKPFDQQYKRPPSRANSYFTANIIDSNELSTSANNELQIKASKFALQNNIRLAAVDNLASTTTLDTTAPEDMLTRWQLFMLNLSKIFNRHLTINSISYLGSGKAAISALEHAHSLYSINTSTNLPTDTYYLTGDSSTITWKLRVKDDKVTFFAENKYKKIDKIVDGNLKETQYEDVVFEGTKDEFLQIIDVAVPNITNNESYKQIKIQLINSNKPITTAQQLQRIAYQLKLEHLLSAVSTNDRTEMNTILYSTIIQDALQSAENDSHSYITLASGHRMIFHKDADGTINMTWRSNLYELPPISGKALIPSINRLNIIQQRYIADHNNKYIQNTNTQAYKLTAADLATCQNIPQAAHRIAHDTAQAELKAKLVEVQNYVLSNKSITTAFDTCFDEIQKQYVNNDIFNMTPDVQNEYISHIAQYISNEYKIESALTHKIIQVLFSRKMAQLRLDFIKHTISQSDCPQKLSVIQYYETVLTVTSLETLETTTGDNGSSPADFLITAVRNGALIMNVANLTLLAEAMCITKQCYGVKEFNKLDEIAKARIDQIWSDMHVNTLTFCKPHVIMISVGDITLDGHNTKTSVHAASICLIIEKLYKESLMNFGFGNHDNVMLQFAYLIDNIRITSIEQLTNEQLGMIELYKKTAELYFSKVLYSPETKSLTTHHSYLYVNKAILEDLAARYNESLRYKKHIKATLRSRKLDPNTWEEYMLLPVNFEIDHEFCNNNVNDVILIKKDACGYLTAFGEQVIPANRDGNISAEEFVAAISNRSLNARFVPTDTACINQCFYLHHYFNYFALQTEFLNNDTHPIGVLHSLNGHKPNFVTVGKRHNLDTILNTLSLGRTLAANQLVVADISHHQYNTDNYARFNDMLAKLINIDFDTDNNEFLRTNSDLWAWLEQIIVQAVRSKRPVKFTYNNIEYTFTHTADSTFKIKIGDQEKVYSPEQCAKLYLFTCINTLQIMLPKLLVMERNINEIKNRCKNAITVLVSSTLTDEEKDVVRDWLMNLVYPNAAQRVPAVEPAA